MKKKIIAMLMAASMVFSLAACGSSEKAPAASTASSGAESSAAATFKLGAIGPLTGDAAIYGNAVMNGAQIAIDEINAKGGVNGAMLELNAQDDEADGEKGVNAYNTLKDWGVQAIVGSVTTGSCISVSAVAAEDRVFMLTPSASSTDVLANKNNMFQVCFTDPNQGVGSADYMAENMAGTKVAVIYRNDDAYSQGVRDTFVAEAAAKGVEIVYEGTFTADTATDFSVQLTAAQSAGADTVFLPIYYQPASVILKQANDMGYAPTFFGVDGMDGILAMEGFDTALAEGVMLLTPFDATATDELTSAFVAEFQKRYNEVPNQFAADGYDAVYVLAAALEKAECTADMDAAAICEALIAVMPTLSVDGLTGEAMTWAETGEVSKAPKAVVIKDGVYVTP